MIKRRHDKKTGTWIYDFGPDRAIVYQLRGQWAVRAGKRLSDRTAPENEGPQFFQKFAEAEGHALRCLGLTGADSDGNEVRV